ncbi:hypothetical protein MMC07_001744 [Pseudocyphellaria aurata]|nr:hypothetical protein [Pseudocyphellaria aurata]
MSIIGVDAKVIESIPPEILKTIPAGDPPPGIQPNFSDPPTLFPALLGVGIAFLVLAVACFFIRIYTKFAISKRWGWDDLTCSLGFACSIVYFGGVINGCIYGGNGRHMWDLHLDKIVADSIMSPAKKLGVLILFMTGGLAAIASTINLYYQVHLQKTIADALWNVGYVELWGQIKMFAGVAVSSMPTVNKFLAHHNSSIISLGTNCRNGLTHSLRRPTLCPRSMIILIDSFAWPMRAVSTRDTTANAGIGALIDEVLSMAILILRFQRKKKQKADKQSRKAEPSGPSKKRQAEDSPLAKLPPKRISLPKIHFDIAARQPSADAFSIPIPTAAPLADPRLGAPQGAAAPNEIEKPPPKSKGEKKTKTDRPAPS